MIEINLQPSRNDSLCNVKALIGPRREKTCLPEYANNKGADQPAHQCSLISAIVLCLLESIISKLATREISIV